MVNSAGSLALADFRPGRDAFLVQRLRTAGAVILGKTNLSEWANFRSTKSSSGWSARRADPQSVRPGSQSLRLQCRHRCGDRRQPGHSRHRHRNRRQHHLPGLGERPGRAQADRGPGQPRRHHSDLGQPGHRRPDDAQRRRCGRRAAGDRCARPAGSGRAHCTDVHTGLSGASQARWPARRPPGPATQSLARRSGHCRHAGARRADAARRRRHRDRNQPGNRGPVGRRRANGLVGRVQGRPECVSAQPRRPGVEPGAIDRLQSQPRAA